MRAPINLRRIVTLAVAIVAASATCRGAGDRRARTERADTAFATMQSRG